MHFLIGHASYDVADYVVDGFGDDVGNDVVSIKWKRSPHSTLSLDVVTNSRTHLLMSSPPDVENQSVSKIFLVSMGPYGQSFHHFYVESDDIF